MEQSFTEPYEGKYRLIVLFAPEEHDPRLTRQIDLLMAEEQALKDRDVYIFIVGGPGAVKAIGDGASGARLDPDSMRERFDVPPDAFRIVIIGKDGTVKKTADEPIAVSDITGLIDSMPMGSEEKRRRDGG